jgi:hypothetical protein
MQAGLDRSHLFVRGRCEFGRHIPSGGTMNHGHDQKRRRHSTEGIQWKHENNSSSGPMDRQPITEREYTTAKLDSP